MKAGSRINRVINITGLSIILITILLKLLRYSVLPDNVDFVTSKMRSALYLLFVALWGMTLGQRIIKKHERFCLLTVAGLEEFWIFIRTLKYDYITDFTVERYIWYLYYLPMLMIPMLCLILAISMGKPESCRLKRFLLLFPIASSLLFILVISNDLHNLVFIIPGGSNGMEVGNYSYGAGYILVVIYISLCILAGYGIIFSKCRTRSSRKARFLPVVPLVAAALLCTLNALGISALFGFYNLDVTSICCICITVTLELCIQGRLILTNNGYDELFLKTGLCVAITDENFEKLVSSDGYRDIPIDNMKAAVNAPVMTGDGIRLQSAKLKHGYVFWQEDISEIEDVVQKLSETNDYLQGKKTVVQQTYYYQKKEQRLIEQNRLYNRILTQTKPEIELYAGLIEKLAGSQDGAGKKALSVKIAFVSAFIKRRDNLIFLNEEEKPIRPAELYYCVEESLSNLRLSGIECYCSFYMKTPLLFEKISELYENFYKSIYEIMENIASIYVYLIEDNGKARIVMRICQKESTDLLYMCGRNISVKKEEGEWLITIE